MLLGCRVIDGGDSHQEGGILSETEGRVYLR